MEEGLRATFMSTNTPMYSIKWSEAQVRAFEAALPLIATHTDFTVHSGLGKTAFLAGIACAIVKCIPGVKLCVSSSSGRTCQLLTRMCASILEMEAISDSFQVGDSVLACVEGPTLCDAITFH